MSDTLNILLLEGSDDDAQVVMDTVHEGGLRSAFHHQPSGEGLQVLLEERAWDLILCNFQLVDISALDLLATVRQLKLDLPVIVLSDGIGEELAVTAMHAGAHDFITKQNLSRLVPAIERELDELAVHRRHQQAEAALHESELRFRQLTENIGEVFWLMDAGTGELIYLSPAFEEVWEHPAAAMLANPWFLLDTVHPEDFHRVQQALEESGWEGFNEEYRIQLPDGQSRWISTRSFPIRDSRGEIYRIAVLSIDDSERKHLAEQKEMMSRALEQSADAVMITDAEGGIVYVNNAFEEVTGYSKAEVLGRSPSFLKSGFQDESFYDQVWKNLTSGIPYTDIFINRRKDGELYYEAKTITPVRGNNGELTHFVSTGKDITQRLKTRERLHKLVHFDAVTGLANRTLLQERMGQAILQSERRGSRLGILYVGFEFSELLGDFPQSKQMERLVRQVAQRLLTGLETDVTLARVGDDAFVVLFKEVGGREEVEVLAKNLVMAFAEPVRADGYELFLTPSVGITLYPDDAVESGVLLEHAELAMQHARKQGQGACLFYRVGMDDNVKYLSN
jgi:PAS domain S-box-containing protein/diguanylate cyclase (GGDEF)-like protein